MGKFEIECNPSADVEKFRFRQHVYGFPDCRVMAKVTARNCTDIDCFSMLSPRGSVSNYLQVPLRPDGTSIPACYAFLSRCCAITDIMRILACLPPLQAWSQDCNLYMPFPAGGDVWFASPISASSEMSKDCILYVLFL